MEIFEITIQHRQDTIWSVVAERRSPSQLPQRSEGQLAWNNEFEGIKEDLLVLLQDAHDYGTYLGKALFQGTVRDKFIAARGAEASQQPLRVLLVVEDPKLKSLHWERLCAPDSSGN